ncbi:MAG: hypothetical protein NTZ73_01645 [Candidatus Diapherotrites archaeon]|nr:hypothetical protein [Candidatus Diapherotrites archaeon]
MAEKRESREILIGMASLLAGSYFVLSGMEVIDIPFRIFEQGLSILLSVLLVGIGVYLLTKNTNK